MRGDTVQVAGISFQRRCIYFPNVYLRKTPEAPYLFLLQGSPARAVCCAGILHSPVLFQAPVGTAVQAHGCAIPTRNAFDTSGIGKWEHANDLQSSQQPWHPVV